MQNLKESKRKRGVGERRPEENMRQMLKLEKRQSQKPLKLNKKQNKQKKILKKQKKKKRRQQKLQKSFPRMLSHKKRWNKQRQKLLK